jgi:hypothetical protein
VLDAYEIITQELLKILQKIQLLRTTEVPWMMRKLLYKSEDNSKQILNSAQDKKKQVQFHFLKILAGFDKEMFIVTT